MFQLSPAAATELLAVFERGENEGLSLRVAARLDADGELAFGMGFDEQREGDMPLLLDGVEVLIAQPSQPLLAEAMLDFVEVEPGRFGFVFVPQESENPSPASDASGACGDGGCGRCGG
jgi:iron-sulfur cluster assembly protein